MVAIVKCIHQHKTRFNGSLMHQLRFMGITGKGLFTQNVFTRVQGF